MENRKEKHTGSNPLDNKSFYEKLEDSIYTLMSHIACAILVVVVLIWLSGCSSERSYMHKEQVDSLPVIDTTKPEGFLVRFKPTGISLGGWLEFEEKGSIFKTVKRQDPSSAVIYFYRPDSRWSQQEIIAANIFLNGKQIDSLKNRHYYPIEIPEGTYRMAIRRPYPTPPTNFQKGTVVDFTVESGQDYYLKYAEPYHVVPPKKSLGLLYKRPLIQMPAEKALAEISSTLLKTQGYIFLSNKNFTVSKKLGSLNGKPLGPVSQNQLSEEKLNHVAQKFKIYNPLTW